MRVLAFRDTTHTQLSDVLLSACSVFCLSCGQSVSGTVCNSCDSVHGLTADGTCAGMCFYVSFDVVVVKQWCCLPLKYRYMMDSCYACC